MLLVELRSKEPRMQLFGTVRKEEECREQKRGRRQDRQIDADDAERQAEAAEHDIDDFFRCQVGFPFQGLTGILEHHYCATTFPQKEG